MITGIAIAVLILVLFNTGLHLYSILGTKADTGTAHDGSCIAPERRKELLIKSAVGATGIKEEQVKRIADSRGLDYLEELTVLGHLSAKYNELEVVFKQYTDQ